MALIEHWPHLAREKDSGIMAGGCVTSSSGTSLFRFLHSQSGSHAVDNVASVSY